MSLDKLKHLIREAYRSRTLYLDDLIAEMESFRLSDYKDKDSALKMYKCAWDYVYKRLKHSDMIVEYPVFVSYSYYNGREYVY